MRIKCYLYIGIIILSMFGCKPKTNIDIQVIDPNVGYPEGPVWSVDNLYYVSYGANRIMKWDGSKVSVFWEAPAGKEFERCGPASIIVRDNGNILMSCYDVNTLNEISKEGIQVAVYNTTTAGEQIIGPNDFIKDKNGGIYFSASGLFEEGAPVTGKVMYMAPDNSIVDASPGNLFYYSNGVALIEDGKRLLVDEHLKNQITVLDVVQPGKLANPNVFADLSKNPPSQKPEHKLGPDGLKVGPKTGNIYACQYAGSRVVVLSPKGEFLKEITMPVPFITNIAFKGDDESEFYVTGDAAANSPDFNYNGKIYKVTQK